MYLINLNENYYYLISINKLQVTQSKHWNYVTIVICIIIICNSLLAIIKIILSLDIYGKNDDISDDMNTDEYTD